MGWEKRKSKMYFYQHQRLPDGRKVKQYFGKGFAAHMAANFLTLRKATRNIEAEALKQMQAETQEADELLNCYSKRVSEVIATEMFIAGYHNPRSRGWRKIMKTESSVATECAKKPQHSQGDTSTRERTAKEVSSEAPRQKHSSRSPSDGHAARMARDAQQLNQQLHEKFIRESAAKQAGKSGDAGRTDDPSEPTKPVEEMCPDELTEESKRGNIAAMNRLRPMMKKDVSHYQTLGDIGANAIVKRLDAHCKEDLFLRECLLMDLQAKRAALLTEGNSSIELLLTDEVLLCRLRHQHWISFETLLIQNPSCFKALKFSAEQTRESQRMYLKALGKLQDYRIAKARLPSRANQDETEAA